MPNALAGSSWPPSSVQRALHAGNVPLLVLMPSIPCVPLIVFVSCCVVSSLLVVNSVVKWIVNYRILFRIGVKDKPFLFLIDYLT